MKMKIKVDSMELFTTIKSLLAERNSLLQENEYIKSVVHELTTERHAIVEQRNKLNNIIMHMSDENDKLSSECDFLANQLESAYDERDRLAGFVLFLNEENEELSNVCDEMADELDVFKGRCDSCEDVSLDEETLPEVDESCRGLGMFVLRQGKSEELSDQDVLAFIDDILNKINAK
jgi:chromosome segregation ATPase